MRYADENVKNECHARVWAWVRKAKHVNLTSMYENYKTGCNTRPEPILLQWWLS